ncbi:MAG: helix-turn-helix domain-containing protein [Peptococcaceae bacterium]|nr:helix-turn-helix domain-containing protein [Peptococcaceae bacterium]
MSKDCHVNGDPVMDSLEDADINSFGSRLKILRTNQLRNSYPRLTQERFGKMLGVSRNSITNLERDIVYPRQEFIDLICKVFRVNKKWLVDGEGPVFDNKTNSNIDYLVDMYKKLSPPLRIYVIEYIQKLLADKTL